MLKVPDSTAATHTAATSCEGLGDAIGVQQLVHLLYERMDKLSEAYTVRKIHPESCRSRRPSVSR